jgi:SAM-dependent methyltransferase
MRQMAPESLKERTKNGEGFDCVTSILTVLHIDAKADVFQRCFALLKPGGVLYLEDYFAAGELTEEAKRKLKDEVGCVMPLPTRARYEAMLREAGFAGVEFEEATQRWWEFVRERAKEYHENVERHRRVQGDREQVDSLDSFYQTVAGLFDPSRASGLGGAVICCSRPY